MVIRFPDRVFSNSGQDSIPRPVLDVYGIPFIPGSSIKGLLRRLLNSQEISLEEKEKVQLYCGSEENQGIIRFHGAYPIGNWANRMIDVVHPQQTRQIKNNDSTSASALISFYQPEFIFEFSNISSHNYNSKTDWNELEKLLHKALKYGLGGKTSTGYGFATPPDYANPDSGLYQNACHISFRGKGISSVLLEGRPEFRSNLFKATIRGHVMRLLAGVCDCESAVEKQTNYLFGSTDSEGIIQLFWEMTQGLATDSKIYDVKGTLHIATLPTASSGDLKFIENVLKFAYVMGGFGKSWRRVWHQDFYRKSNYGKQIGCHWQCLTPDWLNFKNKNNLIKEVLTDFLNDIYQICLNRLGSHPPSPIPSWREAWHPERVSVYAQVVSQSQVIDLFHQQIFKTTSAIGGRNPKDDRPKYVSSVWHRMLPLENNQYLEIITLFHEDRSLWQRRDNQQTKDQLLPFVNAITKQQGLEFIWGKEISQ